MERNPLASLMMGLRGGGGSTEGARAYPGGSGTVYPWQVEKMTPAEAHKALTHPVGVGTQWTPKEVALVQKHFGVSDAKWKNLDYSMKFKLLMDATEKEAAYKKANDLELEKSIETLTKSFPDSPRENLVDIAKTALESQAARPVPRAVPEYLPGQPTVRAYHGTDRGPVGYPLIPAEADISRHLEALTGKPYRQPANIQPKFRGPEPYRTEQGVFFTPDPETASRYAGYSKPGSNNVTAGAKVFPVDLDMRNSVTVDLRKIPGMTDYQRIYDPQYVKTAIEQAKQQNKDFVVIKGMNDVGGAADQIIAVRPAGKVKNALTGETMYAHPLSALLAAALAGGTVSRRQRADETTIAPENIGRP